MVRSAMKELEKWKAKKRYRRRRSIRSSAPVPCWGGAPSRHIAAYEQDFSKHAPNEVVPRIRDAVEQHPGCWTAERGTAEVDFVIDNGSDVIPVEVKAEVNLQAKSLKVYRDKFQPRLCIRTSMADYKKEDWMLNLPLWMVELLR